MDGERWQQVGTLFSKAVALAPDERAEFLAEACAADPDLRGEVESLLDAHARVDGNGFLSQLDDELAGDELARGELARLLDAEREAPGLGGSWRDETSARSDSRLSKTPKLTRFHRAGFAAAAVVTLTALIGLGAALRQTRIVEHERDVARRQAEQAGKVKDFIVDLFRSTDPRDPQGGELSAQRLLERGLERVRADLDGQPKLQLELLTAIGEASQLLGDYQGARSLFAEALELDIEDSTTEDHLHVAAALNGFGEASAYLGDDEVAEEHHRRALAIRLEFAGPDSLETALSYNNLGVALARQRELPEAIEMYARALDIQERIAGEDDPTTLMTLANLGTAQLLQGDYHEAERLFGTAVERMIRRGEDRHPDIVGYQDGLAAVQKRLGKILEAERLLRRSLELARDVWGESHPRTRIIMNNYAMLAHALGNDGEAEALMRKTLKYDLEQYGPEHTFTAIDRDNLGKVLLELGRLDEALAQFEIAEDLHTRWSTLHSLAVHQVHHARARLAAGDPERARRLIDRALASERRREKPSPERLARALTAAASVYRALGLDAEASAQLEEALAIYERLETAQHPDAGIVLFGLGEVRLAQGELDEAGSFLERASTIWSETLPATHWRRAELQVALGELWIRRGSSERGRQLLDDGVENLRGQRGDQHWRTRAAVERRASLLRTDPTS